MKKPETYKGWLTWIGGLLSGIAAIIALAMTVVALLATDAEVEAQMNQVRSQMAQDKATLQATDAAIIQQLLDAVRAQNKQSRQQFLVLRSQILEGEIERLLDKIGPGADPGQWMLQDKLRALQDQLKEVERELDSLMLGT